MNEAFFTIHHDLPREGPGEAADVAWAMEVANPPEAARMLDAGSGPGADIAALLDARPRGHVTAVDTHADFIESVVSRFDDTRVDARQSDMRDIVGPFDFIWSAGAVYFLGVPEALTLWRKALAPGGAVAFSHPAFFTDAPSDAARAFWGGEGGTVGTEAEIRAEIAATGYETLATRPVGEAAWEAYYAPLKARIDALAAQAEAELTAAIDETRAEIDAWRAVKSETGYLLAVVRPA